MAYIEPGKVEVQDIDYPELVLKDGPGVHPDAVGFEARGHGADAQREAPATVLNSLMDLTGPAGRIGIPGLYVTGDPGAADEAAQQGSLSIRIGLGWSKSQSFVTGQCPVLQCHRELAEAISTTGCRSRKAVNATVIDLEDAPKGYQEFDQGAARKYVLDPHGDLRSRGVQGALAA